MMLKNNMAAIPLFVSTLFSVNSMAGDLTVEGKIDLINDSGNAFITIQRGNGSLGGISYKEAGQTTTQWIFPFFRGWQGDNLIIRDESSLRDVMTFEKTTGNVGINTNAPSEILDVNGNVHVSGNVVVDGTITHGEKTGFLWVTPAEFTLDEAASSCNYTVDSFTLDVTDVGLCLFHAGVHLPNGATVTQVLEYVDMPLSDSVVDIFLSNMELSQQTNTRMADVHSRDVTGYRYEVNNQIVDSVIDNAHKEYGLTLDMRVLTISSDVWKARFRGARITYTYESN